MESGRSQLFFNACARENVNKTGLRKEDEQDHVVEMSIMLKQRRTCACMERRHLRAYHYDDNKYIKGQINSRP